MEDSATDATDAVLDEIALLVPRLTGTLDTLSAIARRDLSHTYPAEENERIIDWLYRDPDEPQSGTNPG